jgi:drug/metabolite transporter (DMT)-like permease
MNIFAAVLCILLFSLTPPFTRLIALETSPITIIFIRILGAAVVCIISAISDQWIPPIKDLKSIIAAALGSVIGFNALMAYGLKEVPSGHAAVALATLPLATAVYSTLRDRLNPGLKFWFFALLGTFFSFGFFFVLNIKNLLLGDFLLLLAVISAAFGYVEGGRVSRQHGGRRTMTWAVLLTLPIILPFAIYYFVQNPEELTQLSLKACLSLSYVAVISQALGMFLWFRVLAIGPMAKIALVQLIQPFLTLFAGMIILSETVLPFTWGIAWLVALCVLGASTQAKK